MIKLSVILFFSIFFVAISGPSFAGFTKEEIRKNREHCSTMYPGRATTVADPRPHLRGKRVVILGVGPENPSTGSRPVSIRWVDRVFADGYVVFEAGDTTEVWTCDYLN